ncbi:MAG: glycoside hydrolase family 88 protein [Clostridia bacterium]|nr:glycoside hydrolase family 88 protein [Clostridia bacterium]
MLLKEKTQLEYEEINIKKEKLEKSAEKAIAKLENNIKRFGASFIEPYSFNGKYKPAPLHIRKDLYWKYWINGLYTGQFLLAYELTNDKKFLDVVYSHCKYFEVRALKGIGLEDHDVGFLYSPSCVAAYKVTGDTFFRNTALLAADSLYDHFSNKGWYLRRSGDDYSPNADWHRTMINSMMNIPLLMWAGNESLNGKYTNAAILHCNTTIKYLVRENGSTYHHYQFDPKTQEPVGGVSFQGAGVEGCWSRGQAWAIYGFPIAYSYTKNEEFINTNKKICDYYLSNLPSDGIPYWDFTHKDGSFEPKDSSASAIAICGFLEMNKFLDGSDIKKNLYLNSCASMMESLIDNCTDDNSDGLLIHTSSAVPQGLGIDECSVHGDYFYLEALTRLLKPDWQMYW